VATRPSFFRRHHERRFVHAQWLEQTRAQEFIQRLPGEFFHQAAQHARALAVAPHRARVMQQRQRIGQRLCIRPFTLQLRQRQV
jgi:hypothetical protein